MQTFTTFEQVHKIGLMGHPVPPPWRRSLRLLVDEIQQLRAEIERLKGTEMEHS